MLGRFLVGLAVLPGTACGFSPSQLDDAGAALIDAAVDSAVDAPPPGALQINLGVTDGVVEGSDFPGTWVPDTQNNCAPRMAVNQTSEDLPGTDDDGLFQENIFASRITCSFVLEGGRYRVGLLFGEIFFGCSGGPGAGSRQSLVIINGEEVDQFDSVVLSGGCLELNGVPFERSYEITTNGDVEVEIEGEGGGRPALSAISVLPVL